jgi:prophage antirepressor-like protein
MSRQQIVPFDFQGAAVRVVLDDGGDPWFHGNDVCVVLGYSNPRKAIADHVDVDDVTKRDTIDSLGRTQQVNHVNESGIYALIFGSNKPEAKVFKRWITREVLPTLRKTGQYIVPQPSAAQTLSERFLGGRPWDQVVAEIGGIKSMLAMAGLDNNQCALGAFQRYDALNGTRVLEVLPPEALRLTSPNQCAELRPTDLARRFGIVFRTGRPDAATVNRLLEALGYQRHTPDELLPWTPTDQGRPFVTIKDLPKNAGTGRSERQLFWLDTLLENTRVAQEFEAMGRALQARARRAEGFQRMLELH